MNKPGDIKMIFGNPAKQKYPIQKAKLKKFIKNCGLMEEWAVSYLNDENLSYNVLIKKDDGEN